MHVTLEELGLRTVFSYIISLKTEDFFKKKVMKYVNTKWYNSTKMIDGTTKSES